MSSPAPPDVLLTDRNTFQTPKFVVRVAVRRCNEINSLFEVSLDNEALKMRLLVERELRQTWNLFLANVKISAWR